VQSPISLGAPAHVILGTVDRIRFGRQVRALRHRKRWRQEDLASDAGVSRSAISRVECGEGDRLPVATLDAVVASLGARLECRLSWNGEALDRLLDAAHASLVERVVKILEADGWLVATEVSFNVYGERGSIDILAFHAATSTLLVVEVKSVVPDVQATLVGLDRKVRLAPGIARERGWISRRAARLLIVRESRTSRRRIEAHRHTFDASLPARTIAVRRWLRAPTAGPERFGGLWFLSDSRQAVTRQRVSRRGSHQRNRGGRRVRPPTPEPDDGSTG